MHLSAEDLVDLAEGTRPESSAPHLTRCDSCRSQLADLRAMMAAAVAADVPEPSPLFWDQLSRRVGEAVERDEAGTTVIRRQVSRFIGGRTWNGLAIYPLAGVALLTLVVIAAVKSFTSAPEPTASPLALQAPPPTIDQNDLADAAEPWLDDVWLTFVADLAAGVDADAARDEGLDAMNAEEAVMQLSDGELRELERLLQAQIRNQGD